MDEINEINEANEANEIEQINEINLTLASRWKRLGGAIIDGFISLLITVPIMFATGILQRTFSGGKMTTGEHAFFFVTGWVAFLILHGYLLYKRGQTIGKLLVNTKIVDLNGKIPNFGKILVLRYLVFGLVAQIPFIGPIINLTNILFIFGQERRCLHDYLAGTVVVNESNIEN